MFKKSSSLALLISCSLYASDQSVSEYIGKVSNIYTGKTNTIKVGIIREEGNDLACELEENYQWPLTFERGNSYSEEWFELLNLVRRTQETIRIGYVPSTTSSCEIEYLALMKGDGDGSSVDPAGDGLSRSGQYGNIALIYTNNLTETSYSASDHRGEDRAAAAFDGYIWEEQIADDLGSPMNRNIWLVEKDADSENIEYWLQVAFDREIDISGFRILVNDKSVELGRSPREITVLTSIDGEEFTEQGAYNLSKSVDQRANMPVKITAKYFRIRVDRNYGDNYIEIDELEVYAD
jgi:hypothetical protein